jgi:hypothetical protein
MSEFNALSARTQRRRKTPDDAFESIRTSFLQYWRFGSEYAVAFAVLNARSEAIESAAVLSRNSLGEVNRHVAHAKYAQGVSLGISKHRNEAH